METEKDLNEKLNSKSPSEGEDRQSVQNDKDFWIKELEFNDGWLKAFGRGYGGPCST